MMHKGMVIHYPRLLQLRNEFSTRRPSRRRVTKRLFATELRQRLDRTIQNALLLGRGQLAHVFVRVAMESDFVACIPDFGQLFGEGLDAVGWREESGFDVVFAIEF